MTASILITGGTGSFGQAFIRRVLSDGDYDRVIVFSRDELKQHEMRTTQGFTDPRLRFFIGDVRDVQRLTRALKDVDVVIHAAAMKQVPACEFNPLEAKKTNIDGAQNVIDAALANDVPRVLALSTDKAVDPVNIYGTSKRAAESLFTNANAYSGADGPRFACTRYGNVLASRGSVLPMFAAQHGRGEPLTVTDPSMTRFVLTLQQGVDFVIDCLGRMDGGEVFVPRIPAVDLRTLAQAVTWPEPPRIEVVGRRPGEKQHELLTSENEPAEHWPDRFVVQSSGGTAHRFSSEHAERLDVDGFRALAGMGD